MRCRLSCCEPEDIEKNFKSICCGCCCCTITILVIVLVSISISSLEQLNVALNYDTLDAHNRGQGVHDGRHLLSRRRPLLHHLPSTIQTIQFIPEENNRLETRTSDGLPVSLSLSFQYRHDPSRLQDLYLTYKQQQVAVYEHTAKAVIANVATNFTAYTFFNDKQGIATEMQYWVTRVFDEELFAFVEALQIMRVELPAQFQNAILQSIEAKQNITQAQRYMANMQVTFQTELLIANQTRLQTVAMARGTASQRRQAAEANARVTEQSVYAEMYAYGNLSQTVDLEHDRDDVVHLVVGPGGYRHKGQGVPCGLGPVGGHPQPRCGHVVNNGRELSCE